MVCKFIIWMCKLIDELIIGCIQQRMQLSECSDFFYYTIGFYT